MKTLPFIIEAEGPLKGNIEKGEIQGNLIRAASDVELPLAFINIEADRRRLGRGWNYRYVAKVLLPKLLIQSGNQYSS